MGKKKSKKENKTRKLVLNHIITYPGVNFSTLKNVFDLKYGTLNYHLTYLERKDEIYCKTKDNEKCYYPTGYLSLDQESSRLKLHRKKYTKVQFKIISTIEQHPLITQKDLIYRTRIKRPTLVYNLKKMVDAEQIRQVKVGRNICYQIVSEDEIRKGLLKKLVLKFMKREIDEATFLRLKKKLEAS